MHKTAAISDIEFKGQGPRAQIQDWQYDLITKNNYSQKDLTSLRQLIADPSSDLQSKKLSRIEDGQVAQYLIFGPSDLRSPIKTFNRIYITGENSSQIADIAEQAAEQTIGRAGQRAYDIIYTVTVENPDNISTNKRILDKLGRQYHEFLREEDIHIMPKGVLIHMNFSTLSALAKDSDWSILQKEMLDATGPDNRPLYSQDGRAISSDIDSLLLDSIQSAKTESEFISALRAVGPKRIYFPKRDMQGEAERCYSKLRYVAISYRYSLKTDPKTGQIKVEADENLSDDAVELIMARLDGQEVQITSKKGNISGVFTRDGDDLILTDSSATPISAFDLIDAQGDCIHIKTMEQTGAWNTDLSMLRLSPYQKKTKNLYYYHDRSDSTNDLKNGSTAMVDNILKSFELNSDGQIFEHKLSSGDKHTPTIKKIIDDLRDGNITEDTDILFISDGGDRTKNRIFDPYIYDGFAQELNDAQETSGVRITFNYICMEDGRYNRWRKKLEKLENEGRSSSSRANRYRKKISEYDRRQNIIKDLCTSTGGIYSVVGAADEDYFDLYNKTLVERDTQRLNDLTEDSISGVLDHIFGEDRIKAYTPYPKTIYNVFGERVDDPKDIVPKYLEEDYQWPEYDYAKKKPPRPFEMPQIILEHPTPKDLFASKNLSLKDILDFYELDFAYPSLKNIDHIDQLIDGPFGRSLIAEAAGSMVRSRVSTGVEYDQDAISNTLSSSFERYSRFYSVYKKSHDALDGYTDLQRATLAFYQASQTLGLSYTGGSYGCLESMQRWMIDCDISSMLFIDVSSIGGLDMIAVSEKNKEPDHAIVALNPRQVGDQVVADSYVETTSLLSQPFAVPYDEVIRHSIYTQPSFESSYITQQKTDLAHAPLVSEYNYANHRVDESILEFENKLIDIWNQNAQMLMAEGKDYCGLFWEQLQERYAKPFEKSATLEDYWTYVRALKSFRETGNITEEKLEKATLILEDLYEYGKENHYYHLGYIFFDVDISKPS